MHGPHQLMKQLGMLVRSTTPTGPEAPEFGTPCYTKDKTVGPQWCLHAIDGFHCTVQYIKHSACIIMFHGCGQHLAAICHRNNHECKV